MLAASYRLPVSSSFSTFEHPLFGQGDAAMLFVDGEIAGGIGLAGLFALDDFAAFESRNDAVDLVVFVGRFFARAGNDERRAGFIDQDGIDFVDDARS